MGIQPEDVERMIGNWRAFAEQADAANAVRFRRLADQLAQIQTDGLITYSFAGVHTINVQADRQECIQCGAIKRVTDFGRRASRCLQCVELSAEKRRRGPGRPRKS